jgi:hypothetical protein
MKAIIRIGRAKPGKAGELIEQIETGFVPTIKTLPGVISYYLIDMGDDQIATIPILENNEAAERFDREAIPWIMANARDLVATPPVEYMGEVKLHLGK